jgi:hypothetical protein
MSLELDIELTEENQVIVHFDAQQSVPLDFQIPLTDEEQKDVNWYSETYATHYSTSVDKERAARCAAQLPTIGEKLFLSVFSDEKALELFHQFKNKKAHGRLLIIRARQTAILSLPWELLYEPETTYLCHDAFSIAIRRTHFAMEKTVREPLAATSKDGNLPPLQDVGFFGRSQELWQIERAFVQEETRRFTILGVGGIGKTYLAIKVGQWLYRIGFFSKVCFVDYSTFVGRDAVGLAVRTLTDVLDKPLTDENAVNDALQETPTLLILDNVEKIEDASRHELLDTAKNWSELGECRVLLTCKTADFEHPAYTTGNLQYQSLYLSGLGEEETLAYCLHLLLLPPARQVALPKRDALLTLFKQVAFNPLSIRVLAMSLKTHTPQELKEPLQALLAKTPENNPLWATLMLFLERFEVKTPINVVIVRFLKLFGFKIKEYIDLEEKTLHLLHCLGVFQGGAFEPEILAILELSKKQWRLLQSALESAGLIQLEFLPDFKIPYLHFHPMLAPTLWARLSPEQQNQIIRAYRWRYAELISYLFFEEGKNTELIHALARQDFSNLLYTVYSAADANEKWTAKVANYLDLLLNYFGLKRESAAMNERVQNVNKS